MPAATSSYSPGLPVEVGKIDRELKKLWQQNEGATRASLVNLAVYSELPGSLEANTKLVSELTENLACRAIVIAADARPKENRVEAWIGAHCHVSRAGSKQICSEQISFLVQGPCTNLVPNIVFAHLDSDLPLYLWWQGEFHDPIDSQLWSWVDRLIYDSRDWRDVPTQLALLETAQRQARQRVILCDLNWARLFRIRLALAQFFDHPASHHRFGSIDRVEIVHAPGFRSTAVLLVGWLAAQLHWRFQGTARKADLTVIDKKGRSIQIKLSEETGEAIGKISLLTNEVEFRVVHPAGKDLLEVSRGKPGVTCAHQVLPAGSPESVRLLEDELVRGGARKIYQNALQVVRELL
jgi:glucose-6-phosphate dehydrogenase assembly protein OpcA